MTIQMQADPLGKRRMVIEWSEDELVHIDLDGIDRQLLSECEASERISDKLLALEVLARKLEQAPPPI